MVKRIWVATLLVTAASLPAQTLQVAGGAGDNQVFQRGSSGKANIPLQGTAADAEGRAVLARVVRSNLTLEGFDWSPLAQVSGGRWSGSLAAVPTGGPYHIEVKLESSDAAEAVKDVLVGDLWILAGQSNMQGVGDLIDVEPSNALVHSFDMTDHWVVAEEPLHRLEDAVDSFHWRVNPDKKRLTGKPLLESIAKRTKGAGLGLPFANEMVRRTGVPIGLVPCAHGGTSMDQWSPALKDQGGASLYGAMLRRFRQVGGKVTGLLWYQGESDANAKSAPEFLEKFERFVAAVRQDFGQPDLPFYYVQIGRFIFTEDEQPWNQVQEMQRLAEAKISRTGMVPSIDLSLDDLIHVGTQDLKRLGRRLANLAGRDLFPDSPENQKRKIGPRPASAHLEDGTIRVRFDHVNGRLRAPGRISGFSLHDAGGKPAERIFDASFDPAAPNVVVLQVQRAFQEPPGGFQTERERYLPPGVALYYGYGKDPYCNVTDEADMALPAFGPIEIE